ncbi:pseudouridine synthase [Palleronia sp.]|uniref:pseudouridine synthase n=1 Tax=Palleronia sp. TaxID=1940284 RepID=UPI0035C858A9
MTAEWMREIERRLTLIETRCAVEDVHRANVEQRLTAIEDVLKWLVRLILGAVILCFVGYALSGGFAEA